MIEIQVPFNEKDKARTLGARVVEGKWCIPDGLPEDKKNKLVSLFGDKNKTEKQTAEEGSKSAPDAASAFSWEECLTKSTLHILNALKRVGLPENATMRGRLFRRLNRFVPGDYPVTYDGLVLFYPELSVFYPKETIKETLLTFSGDYKKAIEESRLPDDMKGLLLLVLP